MQNVECGMQNEERTTASFILHSALCIMSRPLRCAPRPVAFAVVIGDQVLTLGCGGLWRWVRLGPHVVTGASMAIAERNVAIAGLVDSN